MLTGVEPRDPDHHGNFEQVSEDRPHPGEQVPAGLETEERWSVTGVIVRVISSGGGIRTVSLRGCFTIGD